MPTYIFANEKKRVTVYTYNMEDAVGPSYGEWPATDKDMYEVRDLLRGMLGETVWVARYGRSLPRAMDVRTKPPLAVAMRLLPLLQE